MNKDVIIALDFSQEDKLDEFINLFKEIKPFVKVGMELYFKFGNQIIKKLKDNGFKIFLDLKLHDIPTTVIKSMNVLKELNVEIINLHASVTGECLKEVSKIFENTNTLVIGVTILTSISEENFKNDLFYESDINTIVNNYAKLCFDSGLKGVVCSAHEVRSIKHNLSKNFLCITPGVRLLKINSNDQSRIVTPKMASEFGSDFIVVGREVLNSEDKVETYNKIKKEFLNEL